MGHTAREMQAGTTGRERGTFKGKPFMSLCKQLLLEVAALVALRKQDSLFVQQICIESSGCQARGNHLRAKTGKASAFRGTHILMERRPLWCWRRLFKVP